jgi:hypothetical protein
MVEKTILLSFELTCLKKSSARAGGQVKSYFPHKTRTGIVILYSEDENCVFASSLLKFESSEYNRLLRIAVSGYLSAIAYFNTSEKILIYLTLSI